MVTRIVLTGGGTGGHTFPLVAISRSLHELSRQNNINLELFYFGPDKWSLDILKKENIRVYKVVSAKLNRDFSLSNFLIFFKISVGFVQNLWLLLKIMPEAIISKGGYGALPTVLVGWLYRIPIIIHESDSIPGLVNKISAVFVKCIAVSFPKALSYFPPKKTILSGNPIRKILTEKTAPETAKKKLGFDSQKPLLLIIGSSQGAEAINDITMQILPKLLEKTQVLHQTGAKHINTIQKEILVVLKNNPLKTQYRPLSFLDEEEYAMALSAADLIISRASAGAIFEIAAAEKPSILIPFPYAASDHQKENAYEYAGYGGAEVVEQSNLLPNLFLQKIIQILENTQKLRAMSESASKFAKKDAADIIAQKALEIAL